MAEVVVCHELTKKFEKIYRGPASVVCEELQKADLRGEFVVIVSCQR